MNEPDDENSNPFVHNDHDDELQGRSELPKPILKRVRRQTARAVPAKHGAPEQRISISPSKINEHFKSRKSEIAIFEDGKSNGVPTPQTPRHRDAVSKKVPVTPRHRLVLHAGKTTPRTPITPANGAITIYHAARQLFARCSNPGRLLQRDDERKEIAAFITTRQASSAAGCMYISGPPGTGKSALVQEVVQDFASADGLKTSFVNCMSVRTAKDLSTKLTDNLNLKTATGFDYLKSCFIGNTNERRSRYLVVLDELDQLVDLDLELLYKLFEWSLDPTSRLILIGIANALDLTDRLLPRLKSRHLKPDLLPFMPYSAAQIAEILTAKLKGVNVDGEPNVPFMQPAAIQLCAKKVASQTGDLRKAFDICRRAIDLVERETCATNALSPSKTPLMENVNLSSPLTSNSGGKASTVQYTTETAPKVTIAHVARITAQIFGNGTVQRLNSLNLQQKAVLCALSALEKRKRDMQVERTMFATPSKQHASAPSIRQLFGAYSQLCKQDNLFHPLSVLEFRDVVSGLETLSLVAGVDGKNGSFAMPVTPSRTPSRSGKFAFGTSAVGDERKVTSAVSQKELSDALQGPGGDLLRQILSGDVLI